MNWGWGDLVFAVALVGSVGFAYRYGARRYGHRAYRAGLGVALAAAFVMAWANLAVGIIGSEDHPANVMFHGVLALAVVGAMLARLRPRGMARALGATALAQLLVGVVALVGGSGFAAPVTLAFCSLWLAAAWLFGIAAREQGVA